MNSGLPNDAAPREPGEAELESATEFQELARGNEPGLAREFIDFLKYNKKWWMTPIVIVTLLLVGVALLLPSPVAPFIYSLF